MATTAMKSGKKNAAGKKKAAGKVSPGPDLKRGMRQLRDAVRDAARDGKTVGEAIRAAATPADTKNTEGPRAGACMTARRDPLELERRVRLLTRSIDATDAKIRELFAQRDAINDQFSALSMSQELVRAGLRRTADPNGGGNYLLGY